jgi:hypothetical protein
LWLRLAVAFGEDGIREESQQGEEADANRETACN